jgi:hypothetical protein
MSRSPTGARLRTEDVGSTVTVPAPATAASDPARRRWRLRTQAPSQVEGLRYWLKITAADSDATAAESLP